MSATEGKGYASGNVDQLQPGSAMCTNLDCETHDGTLCIPLVSEFSHVDPVMRCSNDVGMHLLHEPASRLAIHSAPESITDEVLEPRDVRLGTGPLITLLLA